jgi:hypothetical protein
MLLAVLKPIRLAICLPVVLVVLASGCGSTKTASTPTTATTSPNAGTTLPPGKGAQTATQSTSSKHAPQTTAAEAKPERREKAAEAKPERELKASKRRAEAVKPRVESAEQVPRSHRYPRYIQLKFISSCEAAKGSNSSCECVLTKLEKSNVEKGQSIAELVGLELELKSGISIQEAMRHRVPLPRRVQRDLEECRSRSK